jgi:YHS domain-containing protein
MLAAQQTLTMNFFARVARFLLWLLFVSWSVWLLRRLVGWLLRDAASKAQQSAAASPEVQTTASARRLVRDPVCGMHVDETLSIPLRQGGELFHFCSPACRDAYAVNVRKLAANA